MIFFVTGASGSGKSACMPELARLLPGAEVQDFDSIGVPPAPDKIWRQESTERWIRHGIACAREGRDLVVCGTTVLGEILACPSAPEAGPLAACLLDCGDVARVERLRERGTHGCTQEMLSWAAWLRLHAADPQWRPDVIQDGAVAGMRWERWKGWQRGDPRWQVPSIDTTTLSLREVAIAVAQWVEAARTGKGPGPLDRPPIIGFDPTREAFIEPSAVAKRHPQMPAHVVICFFREVIAGLVASGRGRRVTALRSLSEMGEHAIHVLGQSRQDGSPGPGRSTRAFEILGGEPVGSPAHRSN